MTFTKYCKNTFRSGRTQYSILFKQVTCMQTRPGFVWAIKMLQEKAFTVCQLWCFSCLFNKKKDCVKKKQNKLDLNRCEPDCHITPCCDPLSWSLVTDLLVYGHGKHSWIWPVALLGLGETIQSVAGDISAAAAAEASAWTSADRTIVSTKLAAVLLSLGKWRAAVTIAERSVGVWTWLKCGALRNALSNKRRVVSDDRTQTSLNLDGQLC